MVTWRRKLPLVSLSIIDPETWWKFVIGSRVRERLRSIYVPRKIDTKKGVGCKVFEWNDNKVSIICFKRDEKKVVHMFVIERSALSDVDDFSDGKLSVAHHGGLENGGWIDSKNIYLLVGSSENIQVSDLL